MSTLDFDDPDELITELKENVMHGSFEYDNPSESFKKCTTLHFRSIRKQLKYGVYIIRQRDTKEILYIGKAGTIDFKGIFYLYHSREVGIQDRAVRERPLPDPRFSRNDIANTPNQ